MTVSINIGPDTIAWGPGVGFPFESNVPGPQILPLHIHFELRETETEKLIWTYDYDDSLQAAARGFIRIFYNIDNQPVPVPTSQSTIDGKQAHMSVVVRDDRQVIIDQGERTLPWSNTAAITNELRALPQVSGGFTATDRSEAAQTQAAVQAAFPTQIGGLPDLVLGLGDLFERIGANLIVPAECSDRTGRGSLARPGGALNVNAYGLTWQFTSIPAAFGRRDGAVAVYHERILQLVRVDKDRAGNAYLGESFDIHTEGGRIVWGLGIPDQLLYDVTPGCVVQICWLLL